MGKNPKARPYRCTLCEKDLAEDEMGFVCQHVALGTLLSFSGGKKSKAKPRPDLACTACERALTQRRKNAESEADIHVMCGPCYRSARAKNIDSFGDSERSLGYVLIPRPHYDRLVLRSRPLTVGPVREGREFKLGFCPIPSTFPIGFERMWVRVTGTPRGGLIQGILASKPQLFARRTLKENDLVVFKVRDILEIEPKPVLLERPAIPPVPRKPKVGAKANVGAKGKAKLGDRTKKKPPSVRRATKASPNLESRFDGRRRG